MDKKEKLFKEASKMLDEVCTLYNKKIALGGNTKEAETMLILAVIAVKMAGFALQINVDKKGFIERLEISY